MFSLLFSGEGQASRVPLITFVICDCKPLAEAIRIHSTVSGILINQRQYKIFLYADIVLLFIMQPKISIMSVLSVINELSKFSGYKINFGKSEAMPLGQVHHSPPLSPFRWATEGFVYLGIFITPLLQRMFKANVQPLLKRIHDDLERWSTLDAGKNLSVENEYFTSSALQISNDPGPTK